MNMKFNFFLIFRHLTSEKISSRFTDLGQIRGLLSQAVY